MSGASPVELIGYSDRLSALIDAVSAKRSFDPAAGLSASASLTDFTASSVGWLEATRQSASQKADYTDTLSTRAKSALQSQTGVNIDDEMTAMLDLERSYQASSKIIATVDQMFGALLEAASG